LRNRRSPAASPLSARALYLAALRDAASRPVCGDHGAALHGFLALNAAYFLGEWLTARAHRALVQRFALRLDGLRGLAVPADPAHAAQLAQHVRELAAAFGHMPWTDAMAVRTAACLPAAEEDWNAQIRAATTSGDGHALLLAHARRRLWELDHPSAPTPTGAEASRNEQLRRIARAALRSHDGHTVQLAEARLAEIEANPALAALLPPTCLLRPTYPPSMAVSFASCISA
jgi:hypothetical protein